MPFRLYNFLVSSEYCTLEIGQATVPIVSSSVCNLGSWFDVNLKMTEQINKSCQSVYFRLHNIRQIRKFLTPQPPPNCLYKAWSWHALIIATVFSMAYQLCIFLNCNVFRIPQRDLSPIHPNTVILPRCCLHCIGYRWICYKIAVISLISRLFTIWGLRI